MVATASSGIKQQGPGRWQYQLWLIRHNRLMTNQEKDRRHIQQNNICQFCNREVESSLHALRDCEWISNIWQKLVDPCKWSEFKAKELESWVDWNIGGAQIGKHESEGWQFTFQQVVHHAWTARNFFCHTGNRRKMQMEAESLRLQAKDAMRVWSSKELPYRRTLLK